MTDVDETTLSIDDKIMHGRKAIKLEREMHGEIRRIGQNGFYNWVILTSTGFEICNRDIKPEHIHYTRNLKKTDYDEATGYIIEALAITDSHPESFSEFGQNPLLAAAQTYFFLGSCELQKEGKRNLRKALDYSEKMSFIASKIDPTEQTDILIRQTKMLSKMIKQEMMI